MPDLPHIRQRICEIEQQQLHPITSSIAEFIRLRQFSGRIVASEVRRLCSELRCMPIQLALHALPVAASYALVPVSDFRVGAIAIGKSGTFYFGANQEFAHTAMQQTVHAEQSALMHAWIAGEIGISDIVVNHTPCGHCRQFMNETNSAETLKIHLPHSQNNPLHSYLPDAFGPKDLEVKALLFDPQEQHFTLQGDELTRQAILAAQQSHAPYSKAYSGVAMQVGEQIICGRYAENAAFNPSFLPLQGAFNYYRLTGNGQPISRIVLAEAKAAVSHRRSSEEFAERQLNLSIEYIQL